MKKQAFNPFLPLDKCIPDGEPHVFGDRVYLFGSHEEEGGDKFCSLGYEFYSAPVADLSDWSSKGVNYEAKQDPDYGEKYKYLYAPDVVRGIDGRYYLYYAMSGGCFTGPIHVAVCDTPDGKYAYYGEVKNRDGSTFTRKITFDPAVINDNGTVRLYYGWALAVEHEKIPRKDDPISAARAIEAQCFLFGKSKEEIVSEPQGIMGAFTVTLASDMLTVISEPKLVVPGQFDSIDTEWEGHAFFEGSSIRKIGETYYFVYSSERQHELCYAASKFPDRDFRYGGVIISNGDIGYRGRKESDRVAATGNNHGGIEIINARPYVFYHKHTHKTSFSRKACAEPIVIDGSGKIVQARMTSCGLNGGALRACGEYPASIACVLTNGVMPHTNANEPLGDIPYCTHDGNEHYIADISDGTTVGFMDFVFDGKTGIKVTLRGEGGRLDFRVGKSSACVDFGASEKWQSIYAQINATGDLPLYIEYSGGGKIDLMSISFSR